MKLTSLFQLIRWKNLIIVIFTLWATRSVLNVDALACPIFGILHYTILTLSFVCITAAGNMHNDILDIGMDKINKPLRQVVNRSISIKDAGTFAVFSFALGLISIVVLALTFDRFIWVFYYLFFAFLLYIYNVWLKCRPLVGNILVSVLCGSVVLAPVVLGCEPAAEFNGQKLNGSFFVLAYSVMAVLLNFIRELIKDMEDIIGDRELECRTFPVAFGESSSRLIIYVVSIVFVGAFLWALTICAKYFEPWSIVLALIIICLPFAMFLFSFYKSETGGYRKAQQWLKVMLLAGLLVLMAI